MVPKSFQKRRYSGFGKKTSSQNPFSPEMLQFCEAYPMSQRFYEQILALVLGFLVNMVLTIASTEFLTVYILKGNLNYYYGYLVAIGAAAILGNIYFDKFRRIKHDSEFLIPNNQIKDERFERAVSDYVCVDSATLQKYIRRGYEKYSVV